jgi:hypothetical protein
MTEKCPCCGGFGYHDGAPGPCGGGDPEDGAYSCVTCGDDGVVEQNGR